MARITNPKVASLAPTWRRYRGVSVLFDNPGARAGPGVIPLERMPIDDPTRQRLYDDLMGVMTDVDLDAMREQFGFCPLPRYSYHVTVCDGPNERDIAEGATSRSAQAAAVIHELPDSLHRLPDALGFLCRTRVLPTVAANPVTFEAAGIAIWGHVLAARLEPDGRSSQTALERVAQARTELANDLWAQLGLRTQAWRPHVSLGYFPNRSAAKAATATLPRWDQTLAMRPLSTITFDAASVYGFTDMVSFLRLGV